MSANPQESQPQVSEAQKPSDKELNFRRQEEMFKRRLDQEMQARQKAEELLAKIQAERKDDSDEDASDDEPYVDHRRLKKELGKVAKQTKAETQSDIHNAVQSALALERQQSWVKSNPDFFEIMDKHAQTFAERDPELAETILAMPEGFERQKLVYKNIKALGLHKKEEAKPSIQDKVDQNRRSPYYQPSGMGSSPYAAAGDFSPTGQKSAYSKMQELKNRLRI